MMNDEQEIQPKPPPQPVYTMGSIVTWAIIRAAIVIVLSLVLYEYVKWIEYSVWWAVTIMALFGIVLHPAQLQYRIYREQTKHISTNTLCASCRHFEQTAVMCLKHDEHVTESYLPCDGIDWEPGRAEGN